jgi:hypothetical protein
MENYRHPNLFLARGQGLQHRRLSGCQTVGDRRHHRRKMGVGPSTIGRTVARGEALMRGIFLSRKAKKLIKTRCETGTEIHGFVLVSRRA